MCLNERWHVVHIHGNDTPSSPILGPVKHTRNHRIQQPPHHETQALHDGPAGEDANHVGSEREREDLVDGHLGRGLEGDLGPVDDEVEDEPAEDDHEEVVNGPAGRGQEGVEVEEVVEGLQLFLGFSISDTDEDGVQAS